MMYINSYSFTVCASKWQVEFFRDQPNEVLFFHIFPKHHPWPTLPHTSLQHHHNNPATHVTSQYIPLIYVHVGKGIQ